MNKLDITHSTQEKNVNIRYMGSLKEFDIPTCLVTVCNTKHVLLSQHIDVLRPEGNTCAMCQKILFGTKELEIILSFCCVKMDIGT